METAFFGLLHEFREADIREMLDRVFRFQSALISLAVVV
jgi:hypothetical protein